MTDQETLMRRAMSAAATARLRARPNPWVGAVLVCADGSIFDGATQPVGGAHAEIEAINAALAAHISPVGAALYCTLEPCSHTGRTGPCTEAIIAAGISRVVVGIEDPDPRVAGTGIARLREAGVVVDVGVCAQDITEQLAPYLHHRRTGRPYVVLKMACTLDGKTTAPHGERWITGETARIAVHQLRAESDVIIVGSGTVRVDDPELTTRHVDGPSPRRIVLTSTAIDGAARVQPCETWNGDLQTLLDKLGSEGVLQVMVEGGPTVARAFHDARLINRYVFHVAPIVHGDPNAPGVFAGDDTQAMCALDTVSTRALGDDLEIVMSAITCDNTINDKTTERQEKRDRT